MKFPFRSAAIAIFAIGIFLTALGARFTIIDKYGNDVPFLDQWDAEARNLYLPYSLHELSWQKLFAAHNEHRIVLTRIFDLGLLFLSGQWDPRTQAVLGNTAFSTLAFLTAIAAFKYFPSRTALFFGITIAIIFSLPFGYENTLCGFQSQVFFLILLSILSFYALSAFAVFSLMTWVGILGICLALGSMGSGFLAALAVLPVALWRGYYTPVDRHKWLVVAGILAAVGCVGILARVSVPEHVLLQADSSAKFFKFFFRCAAWPLPGALWPALVYAIPWFVLIVRELKRRTSPSAFVACCASLGIWCLLQMAAVAYGRGGDGGGPTPRYTDILSQWLIVNCGALCYLFHDLRERRKHNAVVLLSFIWCLLVAIGLISNTRSDFASKLPAWKQRFNIYQNNVRAYINSQDANYLTREIPYDSAPGLKILLDDSFIRSILPSGLGRTIASEVHSGNFPEIAPPDAQILPQGVKIFSSYPASRESRLLETQPLRRGHRAYWRIFYIAAGVENRIFICDAKSGLALKTLHVATPSLKTLGQIDFFSPEAPVMIRASSPAGSNWLAFAAPIEISLLSMWAERIVSAGIYLAFFGILMMAVGYAKIFASSRLLNK